MARPDHRDRQPELLDAMWQVTAQPPGNPPRQGRDDDLVEADIRHRATDSDEGVAVAGQPFDVAVPRLVEPRDRALERRLCLPGVGIPLTPRHEPRELSEPPDRAGHIRHRRSRLTADAVHGASAGPEPDSVRLGQRASAISADVCWLLRLSSGDGIDGGRAIAIVTKRSPGVGDHGDRDVAVALVRSGSGRRTNAIVRTAALEDAVLAESGAHEDAW